MSKTKTRTTPGFKAALDRHIAAVGKNALLYTAGVAMEHVFRDTPIEDGHTHRAWKEATADIPELARIGQTAMTISGIDTTRLSDDPVAFAAGKGEANLSGKGLFIRLINTLGFVETLEYGGVLTPIEPGGSKVNGVRRPPEVGPLYGPRSTNGMGLLVWTDESGRTVKARSKSYAPGGYVRNALSRAKKAYEERVAKAVR